MITHNESISIADYFTLRDGPKVVYRPTCHYAYHPCDDAVLSLHEMAGAAWKPQKTYIVSESPQRVELGLDVWTLRGGWASMQTPLRGWALFEVGELASAGTMPGVVARMMTGETPQERRWKAVGGGFGVAWPMSDNARLIGMIELAIRWGVDFQG